MKNNVKWTLIRQWTFVINSDKLNAFFPVVYFIYEKHG
jgi:hypothetical protein